MAHRLLRDPEADGWERSDFPVVCEDCLGPNPYIRMQKTDYGAECAISGRPFTVFRWKPGADARYKKTVICREVALAKNVCQVCLLDLQYGVPVQVRDAALAAAGGAAAGGAGGSAVIPKSATNREYATEQVAQQIARGEFEAGGSHGDAESNELLRKLARTKPYYKRNRARICTFWLRNACTRTDCPFRPCNGDTDMPELNSQGAMRQQNMKDRYFGVNDPVAEKMLSRAAKTPGLEPPEDTSITTLWIGGLDERVDEEALKDHFYAHGELKSIRLVRQRNCAFVTYTQRAAAEAAAKAFGGGSLIVKGLRLKLMWGKPQAQQQRPANVAGMPGSGPVPHPMAPPPYPGAAAVGGGRPQYPSMDPSAMGSSFAAQPGAPPPSPFPPGAPQPQAPATDRKSVV